MDTNDTTQNSETKTEDHFPNATGAWANAWCMDPQNFTAPKDKKRSDLQKSEDPNRRLMGRDS